jgi:hypothetical protein
LKIEKLETMYKGYKFDKLDVKMNIVKNFTDDAFKLKHDNCKLIKFNITD